MARCVCCHESNNQRIPELANIKFCGCNREIMISIHSPTEIQKLQKRIKELEEEVSSLKVKPISEKVINI